jgi:hypothetical protein
VAIDLSTEASANFGVTRPTLDANASAHEFHRPCTDGQSSSVLRLTSSAPLVIMREQRSAIAKKAASAAMTGRLERQDLRLKLSPEEEGRLIQEERQADLLHDPDRKANQVPIRRLTRASFVQGIFNTRAHAAQISLALVPAVSDESTRPKRPCLQANQERINHV